MSAPHETPAVDLAAITAHLDAADDMVRRLNLPRGDRETREWIMSIPARPDYDPDLVIGMALHDARTLLAENNRLQAERDAAEARARPLEAERGAIEAGRTVTDMLRGLPISRKLIAALGLSDDACDADALDAVTALRAENARQRAGLESAARLFDWLWHEHGDPDAGKHIAKMLGAATGERPGYDPDADAFRTALAGGAADAR